LAIFTATLFKAANPSPLNGASMPLNDSPPFERASRVRWFIFFVACASSLFLYLHRYSWGVIKPSFLKEHPEITSEEIGSLDAAFGITYAFGQVPAGLAADLFGPRLVLGGIILLWSISTVGVAWVAVFWQLWCVRAALGLTQAGCYPVLSKVTRNWFPQSVRTSVQGVVAAMGRIGAACSSLLVASVLIGYFQVSWQSALVGIALPGAALSVAWWLIVRNSPRQHPRVNAAELALIERGTVPPSASSRVKLHRDRRTLLNLAMLLLYAFASNVYDAIYLFWIPTYLIDRGLTQSDMGLFNTLPFIGAAIGGICGGMLNDYLIRRTGNRRWSRSGVAFTGKFIAAGCVALSVQTGDGRIAMVVLLVARFFGDWSLPTQWGAMTDMGGRAIATIFGFVNSVGALGVFAAGYLYGNLKSMYGWEGLFLGAAVACLVSALSWLFVDCTKRLVDD
jgi:sugar phosphate permease